MKSWVWGCGVWGVECVAWVGMKLGARRWLPFFFFFFFFFPLFFTPLFSILYSPHIIIPALMGKMHTGGGSLCCISLVPLNQTTAGAR